MFKKPYTIFEHYSANVGSISYICTKVQKKKTTEKKKWLLHCDGIRDSTRPSSKTLRASSPLPAFATNLIANAKAVKHKRKDRYLDFTKNTTEVAVDVAPDGLVHGLSSSFSIMI